MSCTSRILTTIALSLLTATSLTAQTRPDVGFSGSVTTGRSAAKTAFAAGDAFGVYAYSYSQAAWSEALPFNSSMLMYNVAVTKQSGGGWTYDTKKYWETGSKVSFFAYYPYNAATVATGSNGGVAGAPVITYTNPPAAASQKDLMYAELLDQSHDGVAKPDPVKLTFNHALAQVTFQAKLSLGLNVALNLVKITSITVEGLVSKGNLNLSTGAWALSSTTNNFTAGLKQNISLSITEYVTLTAGGGGELMIIPQGVAGKKVVIEYSVAGIAKTALTKTLSGSWDANKIYTVKLDLSIPAIIL